MASEIIRFGMFEVNFAEGELRRKGMRVRIQKIPFDLLEVLIRRSGEVVSRDEIRQELWGEDVFVDFEHGLNVAASKLRQALGDVASAPRYFEAVRGRGYRFIAPVDVGDAGGRDELPRLVVRPFQAAGSAAEEFREGLYEELMTELGRMGASAFRVIARTSVRRFENTWVTASEIGRNLEASHLLEGSVRRGESGWRINARLIDLPNDSLLWSERFEPEGDDQFEVEIEGARQLARAVSSHLGARRGLESTDRSAVIVRRASGLAATRTQSDMLAALAMLDEAAERSPHESRVQSALANHLNTVAEYGLLEPRQAYPRARAAARRAVDLDPDSAEGHASLGVVAHRFDWDWEDAESFYRRALSINPSDVRARQSFAEFLSQMSRHNDAIYEIREARRLDPMSAVVNAVEAWILFHASRLEAARTTAELAIHNDESVPLGHFVLGRVHLRERRVERAIVSMGRAVETSGDSPYALAGLALALARAGQTAEAVARRDELMREDRINVSPYLVAKIEGELGQLDRAFELLERGVEMRTGWMVDLRVDPELGPLRPDPRFEDLCRRVGLV